jgi:hypothetical protein
MFSEDASVWNKGGPRTRVWIRVNRIWKDEQIKMGRNITTMKGVKVPPDYMAKQTA